MNILALAGGVGGAKLAHGLQQILGNDLSVLVNTADDFEYLGLHISPDLDTVMYTLAGLNNPETGWGLMAETWQFLDSLQTLGGPAWFRLGDRDLATHVLRTHLMASGMSLAQVTDEFRMRLGLLARVLPMTNDRVRTLIHSDIGVLSFQEYFVARRCEPVLQTVELSGIESARPLPAVFEALETVDLIVICPSNPFVSIAPILALPGLSHALRNCGAPIVAVSPIVGHSALKGPAAKMLKELGREISAKGVADAYGAKSEGGLLDGFVIQSSDKKIGAEIEQKLNLPVLCTETIMKDIMRKEELAEEVVKFGMGLKSAIPRTATQSEQSN